MMLMSVRYCNRSCKHAKRQAHAMSAYAVGLGVMRDMTEIFLTASEGVDFEFNVIIVINSSPINCTH